MSQIFHFLKLIRFGNLLVIGLSMCVIQVFIAIHGNSNVGSLQLQLWIAEDAGIIERWLIPFNLNLNFFLLTFSVMLIAGAGNIINDYFDVKADRVNKPERLIVGKFIKRRWAIMLNWIFNAVGLIIALYLSIYYQNWFIVIIAFLTINFLWFYSAVYKRKLFVGNILVALMVGIVPLYVMIYNFPFDGYALNIQDTQKLGNWFIFEVIFIISIVAFVINLMREIIKDIADIRGDMHLSAKTVPIALGIKSTKIILLVITIPLLTLMAFYMYNIQFYSMTNPVAFAPVNLQIFNLLIGLSMLLCSGSYLLLISANRRKIYLLASNLLKLAMLFGMISPLFL